MNEQLTFVFPPAGSRFVRLTGGKVAIVDEADFDRVNERKWRASEGYAVSSVAHSNIRMHRFILNAPDGFDVDHINGDTLDNRRANIRVCTRAQNNQNQRRKSPATSSSFKGVSWNCCRGKWRATIRVHSRQVHLGQFVTELDAALAYDAAAREYFGEFAAPNFPERAA